MKFLFAMLLFMAIHTCSFAQFNDTTHYLTSFGATGNFNKTNDGLTMIYNNNLKFSSRFKRFDFNSAGSWLYGKNPQKVSNNDWNALADFNLTSNHPQFYYWGLFNFTSSLSLRVNQQYQTGLGVAYRFFSDKPFNFSISNGILYEFSNINTSESELLVYQTLRNSLRVRFHYSYNDRVKTSFVIFHQPSLNYKNDYILSSNASLQFKIWKWININTSFTYNKVSRTNKENMIFTYGIIAERFF